MNTIGRPAPLASLPMYDWPQVAMQTDVFWSAVRRALNAAGVAAPADLDRTAPLDAQWRSPQLLLSQTCGWPLVHDYRDDLHVVARPAYAVEGCGRGSYRSAIVARRVADVEELARETIAINGRNSLSGYWALAGHLADQGIAQSRLGPVVETGSHRGSLQAVAEGRAAVAAIDCVSWRLAIDHEPAAGAVTVTGWTAELPALPFVTSAANAHLASILRAALQAAAAEAPQSFLVEALAASLDDYDVVASLTEKARAAGY